MKGIEEILVKLPSQMQKEIYQLDYKLRQQIEEIRIRVGSPVIIVSGGREYFLKGDGSLPSDNMQVRDIFNSIINHSAYAYQEELSKGFITIEGGHRVGVCGKVILEKGTIKSIKDISSLNIRRCREIIGVSDPLMPKLFNEKGGFLHTIIISPPMCGKTTLLRDIIRNLSSMGFRVGVCDERSELAGSNQGAAGFDLGHRTDVLDGCPKSEGMLMLIRGMSPNIIAADEMGKPDDLPGIEGALCAGVGLLTTIHGGSREELMRSSLGHLVSSGVLKRYVFLSNIPAIGTVSAVTDERGQRL
ncbi:stage III sporulation protein AA [Bacillota bacterium]